MKVRSVLVLFLSLLAINVFSQNQAHFFKTVPHLNGTEPDWVQLMYSNNPNVFKVVDLYDLYHKKNRLEKTIHTQNYKHWLLKISVYLNDEGFINYNNEERQKKRKSILEKRKQLSKNKQVDIWSSIGPFETFANDNTQGVIPVSWQVNVYCLDQSESNPNTLYAGTEGQGAWKTIDKGLNWFLVTKDEDIGGVTDIKVAASDENLVYLAGGGSIYKSINGGSTWSNVFSVSNVYQIIIHPTNSNIVFIVGANGLHKTSNGGVTWTQQYSSKCWDINFHPTNPNVVYLLRHNATLQYAEFWKSINGGTSFSQVTNTWYDPVDPSFTGHNDIGALIAVTPLEPDKVYVAMMGNHKAADNAWIGVYRSADQGQSWVNPIQDGGPYSSVVNQNLATIGLTSGFTQGFYDFGFDASHTVSGKLYLGVLALSVSDDGADSWTRIGGYSAPAAFDVGWIHPDVQDIHVLGSDVWVATDGGINYSDDEFVSHVSRKNGLAGSHFWGFDQGWNEDVLVGGRYHNGNSALYEIYGTGNSTRLGGGEAPTGYVDLLNNFKTYYSDIATRILDQTNVGVFTSESSLTKYPHQSYFHAANSEIVRDPRYAHHLYLGASSGTQDGGFWKSIDNGKTFQLLHDFGSAKVTGIEISRINPDNLYCVYGGNTIYKSTDGGNTWAATSSIPGSGNKMISINPEDDDELWVFVHSNDNSNKVFRTTDGGGNWDNLTTPTISGYRINDGFFQGGSNSIVYIVSAYGLFYWDNTLGDWVDYHMGLPFAMGDVKHVFKPSYKNNKIRLSSVRGIWEAAFFSPSLPLAHPMTKTDTIFCSRDTVYFDCHSILDHDNASWQWTITPTPIWINANNVRNPKAILADDISYDVELLVTDGNGNSSSKLINNMVTVLSQCESEQTPGLAIETLDNGDWAQIPNLNLSTNNFSISAWIKPNGIQNEYSGIVINDDVTAGFNFRESNNTLAYHWPGGAWWWDSNLEVESDKWSHVVMVASPNSMTLYVNGIAATHNVNLSPVDLGSMKIGSYKGWGGRNYNGLIDEVCMWNRSLTQSEVRELRHLTQVPTNDPNIIAYYQFNNLSGSVLDRAGVNHANLIGGTSRLSSTAPLGGGVSFTNNLITSGTFNFGSTGLELTVSSTGVNPNGEVVASHLYVVPDSIGSEKLPFDEYWILDNYGSNQLVDVESLSFTPKYQLPPHFISFPSNATLNTRTSNEFINNWLFLINAVSGNSSDLSFSGMGPLNLGQFLIYDVNCPDEIDLPFLQVQKDLNLYAKDKIIIHDFNILNNSELKMESPIIELLKGHAPIQNKLFTIQKNGCINN